VSSNGLIGKTKEKRDAVRNGIIRLFLAGIAVIVEFLLLISIALSLYSYAEWIAIGTRLTALFLVLAIYSRNTTASMKTPWIILIMTAPVLGVMLYLMIGLNVSTRKMRFRYEAIDRKLLPMLPDHRETVERLRETDAGAANLAGYLKNHAGYPLYDGTQVIYYDDAAEAFEAQLQEISKAEHFVFMEYHAIEEAEAFARLEAVLLERVHAGVEVRLFYDDMGSIGFINTDFVKRMREKGIACRVFNPVGPFLNLFLNNRDHRKITVIDGRVGFTGGYNLADEYFHLKKPYGEWKDSGVKLMGDAVRSLTVTFLEMWNAVRSHDTDDVDFERYLPQCPPAAGAQGYVQPYADNPIDDEHVGENVYISIIESAERYVYFITPYLILSDEMIHAMGLAAKRGVDVRLITPGIPDKKIVYGLSRSYYNSLVRSGVRIFEWTPGFCHAKMCVSDDRIATCGTINLDFRSLYHHFENGCLLIGNQAVIDIRTDFENTFPNCREVTGLYGNGRPAAIRVKHVILRLFAALM